jgi:aminopeptidase 2
VPLRLLSIDTNGKAVLDNNALLVEREQTFEIDSTKAFKLNTGTSGVCKLENQPVRKYPPAYILNRSRFI